MIDLIQYKNDEVKSFQEKIIPDTKYEILGIYSKIIKEIAKENKNNKEFLKEEHHYLEEYMVHALILGYLKDFNLLTNYLSSFVLKIDNWALCDTLCASLKITSKYMDEMLEFISQFNTKGYLVKSNYKGYIDNNKHVIIFGNEGVGKTQLALWLAEWYGKERNSL